MDFFQSALQGKASTMYEYYLVGSVLDNARDGFLEILRGLCDNPEHRPIEFNEIEYVFSTVNQNGSLVHLRARQQRQLPNMPTPLDLNNHCHLRYVGQTDFKMDKERKTMVRNYIDCLTSANLNDYLMACGFNLEMEMIIRGHLFHKGRLKITVSKIIAPSGPSGEMQPVTASNLVEISCIMSAGHENVGDDVKRFADLLKPYVRMDKMHQIHEELNI